jgi:BlaR1 peptidase M56
MNELVLDAVNLSATATGALVSAIWQGALLAAVVFFVLRMLPGLSAAARSVIWLNVFILLALLHILPVFTGAHEAVAPMAEHAVRLSPLWSLAVAGLWAGLSLVRVIQLVAGAVQLRRMGRRAVPVEFLEPVPQGLKPTHSTGLTARLKSCPSAGPAPIESLPQPLKLTYSIGFNGTTEVVPLQNSGPDVVRLQNSGGDTVFPESVKALLMHNGHVVALCVSDEVARPSVLGFFRPRILVPPALLEQLSEAELRQVILHEMEHLHRGDDWTNLLQKLALVLFPLNPALAWVERRLCAERELACDDRVLHAGSGRKAYALCLTHLAEFALVRRGFSLVLGAWERRPELVRRVQRILSEPARQMGRKPALAAMAGLTAGALACTLALARAPQIVRFGPLTRVAQAQNVSSALDAHEVARALGGTPQLVKAVMPAAGKAGQKAVLRRRVHKAEPPARLAEARLADLRTPAPEEIAGTLLVMTDFDDMGVPPQVVIAVQNMHKARRPLLVRCTYAVVRTPDGWLVIQI